MIQSGLTLGGSDQGSGRPPGAPGGAGDDTRPPARPAGHAPRHAPAAVVIGGAPRTVTHLPLSSDGVPTKMSPATTSMITIIPGQKGNRRGAQQGGGGGGARRAGLAIAAGDAGRGGCVVRVPPAAHPSWSHCRKSGAHGRRGAALTKAVHNDSQVQHRLRRNPQLLAHHVAAARA